jgi:hypothetical protein
MRPLRSRTEASARCAGLRAQAAEDLLSDIAATLERVEALLERLANASEAEPGETWHRTRHP